MQQIRFTTASRKHRVGRAHVRYVLATSTPIPITTNRGDEGWLYVGSDERGVLLEVIAVEDEHDVLVVVHAMPRRFRGGG